MMAVRVLLGVALFVLAAESASFSSKIGQTLQKSLDGSSTSRANIFVAFDGIQSALAQGQALALNVVERGQRNTLIHQSLLSHSEKVQAEALNLLASLNFPQNQVKSFWINNQLYIKDADESLINALAKLNSVSSIEKEITAKLHRPIAEGPVHRLKKRDAGILAEWNIEKMGAHRVWEQGHNGTGVVVGFIDTGVRGTHEAIRSQYRNDGKAWRDPYNQYTVPTDIYNHGTHTVGSVVGSFGIGSAPGAQWIACKGYKDDGSADLSAFTECGQFMVCPTDANGLNPDCTKTPHVTSNSWGVWPGTDYFEDILDVWHSVGIISMFSNGNEGLPCGDLLSPADSAKTMGIGATDMNDALAGFSSRGPSRYGVHKPDVSAPGVGIRSCDCRSDNGYAVFSGTSMSCPNAAGIVTLMVSKNRQVTYDRVKSLLEETAVRDVPAIGESCGGVPDTQWPNNHMGAGRIDGFAAVSAM